jgi:nucleotide-binding universal stress UspA family protein
MYIPEPRVVIVGYDGSPNARTALRHAVVEARQRHARLDVVQVYPAGERGRTHALAAWMRLRNSVARAIPRSRQVNTRLRIAYGSPGEVLSRLAAGAELLAIGARSSEHPFGGDTVPVVLATVRCDVLISTHQRQRRAASTMAPD